MFDPQTIKKQFPVLEKEPGLVYLDSTATALKPQGVIDKISEYYSQYPVNVFRGVYPLSEKATEAFENVRKNTAQFINAPDPQEVIFTRNTTESLNLLAYSLTQSLEEGDEIAVTAMEHHSNFVPWQQLAQKHKLKFTVIPFNENGHLEIETLGKYISENTKIFALTHVSNVLGTINPVKDLIHEARRSNPNIVTVIDGAQAAPHMQIDIQDIGCDFYAFSAHKMFGPTGVGVLWGRASLLYDMEPFLYGGEMVQSVSIGTADFKEPPYKFEAGTPAIGEVIGFQGALDFIGSLGYEKIQKHEEELAIYTLEKLNDSFGNDIHILGPKNIKERCSLFSFTLSGVHPHDIAQILGEENVCVRAGSHCAMPLHKQLNFDCPASVRVSFSIYNTKEDVDKLVLGLKKAINTFNK
jgi:cysteine desulfurase/selenocysteine lyase